MKKLTTLCAALLCMAFLAKAQGEGDTWMADGMPSGGFGGSNYGLRFNSSIPEVFYYDTSATALSGIQASQSIADASGNPLFFTGGTSCKVYDRHGNIMPNGNGLNYPTIGTTYSLAPLITPHPGNSNQYYVIYQKNGAVYYSIVDMSLNGGMGDVISKNTSINGFAGVAGIATYSKLTLVQGCSSTWIVVRSKNVGQYRAYEISTSGINTTPVISAEGDFPVAWYNGDVISGKLKASPDGKRLATTVAKFYDATGNAYPQSKGGIELYDFEKCSGRIKNAMIIDSSQHYDGIAFSPDNTKLYASSDTTVYQFDLSLYTPAAILASKTYMLSSPPIPVWTFMCYCDTTFMPIGDLKLSSNGKIYMGNNTGACGLCLPSAATAKYHSIEQPNLAGLAATPIINTITFPIGYITGADLPPDIVLPPANPDTVTSSIELVSCFTGEAILHADTNGMCHKWDNGLDSAVRVVNTSGVYYVRYFTSDCMYHIDTFNVQMVPLPLITKQGFSCPNDFTGEAVVAGESGFAYNYSWLNADGSIVQTVTNRGNDTVSVLGAGTNFLHITTTSGCDTTLQFEIQALPIPEASFMADTVVCNGKPLTFTNTSDAPLQYWEFGDGHSADTRDAIHAYGKGGEFNSVLKVTNIEGCSDTANRTIYVKQLLLKLIADDTLVEHGILVNLHASAPEPYTVTSWEPLGKFPNPLAYNQQATMLTTETFRVNGVSVEHGCEAAADVTVTVEPFMQIPNAFSPNGDGLNDYFSPVITGYDYKLQSFLIFNRWGQCVYEAYLNNGLTGWDGSYKGQPVDLGTYFYQIVINNPSGKQVMRKGEINLIR